MLCTHTQVAERETGSAAALERLEATLAVLRGSTVMKVGFTPLTRRKNVIGAFVLQNDVTRLQANIQSEPDDDTQLRLVLDRMDTEDPKRQRQGHGSAQLQTLFDIADASGVNRVDVTCAETGRYAHAANHARALTEDWHGLQSKLRNVLSGYYGRGVDIDRVAEAIARCDGKLGLVVDAARQPLADSRLTLGQKLFLDSSVRAYHACWLPEDRAAFRAKRQTGILIAPSAPHAQSARQRRLTAMHIAVR